MRQKTIAHIIVGLVAALLAFAPTAALGQEKVASGYDLFETDPGTTDLLGVNFEGVPLNNFDFGTLGVHPTGFTDTIVQRLNDAVPPVIPGPAPLIQIELVELQLRSVAPVDMGAGLDFHFITLDPAARSFGEMEITFDDPLGGTFDSYLDVHFDLRMGALDGPVIYSDILQLSASVVPWDRTPPPGAVQIHGVNRFLNDVDESWDFWPAGVGGPGPFGTFTESHPSGAQHTVGPATPEPATLSMLALGGLAILRRRKK